MTLECVDVGPSVTMFFVIPYHFPMHTG